MPYNSGFQRTVDTLSALADEWAPRHLTPVIFRGSLRASTHSRPASDAESRRHSERAAVRIRQPPIPASLSVSSRKPRCGPNAVRARPLVRRAADEPSAAASQPPSKRTEPSTPADGRGGPLVGRSGPARMAEASRAYRFLARGGSGASWGSRRGLASQAWRRARWTNPRRDSQRAGQHACTAGVARHSAQQTNPQSGSSRGRWRSLSASEPSGEFEPGVQATVSVGVVAEAGGKGLDEDDAVAVVAGFGALVAGRDGRGARIDDLAA